MINERRVTRIEVSLTPKAAVRLWLQREFLDKTSRQYARWLVERPLADAPLVRIEKQVRGAVLAAMQGEETSRVRRAVRQAAQEADLLILMVSVASSVVVQRSQSGWLRWVATFLRLSNSCAMNDNEQDEWESNFRDAAIELLSIPAATDQISRQFFEGDCILPKDLREDLEIETAVVRGFINALDDSLARDGYPDSIVFSNEFQNTVAANASKLSRYIYDLAKSKMLQHFGYQQSTADLLKTHI